jgi:hypothetical protein
MVREHAATPAPHDLRGTFAAELDRAAITTGDRRYRHAASILRSPPAGRPRCVDDQEVTEVRWLFEAGRAPSIEVAARMVATALPGEQSVNSATRRLARKARAAAPLT